MKNTRTVATVTSAPGKFVVSVVAGCRAATALDPQTRNVSRLMSMKVDRIYTSRPRSPQSLGISS